MSSELVVVKANSLIEASYRLSIDEIRILALTIGTMNPKSKQKTFDFTVTDFVREFPDISLENAYKQIQSALKRIFDRSVRIEDEQTVTVFRWVSSRTYFKSEGRFRISMTDEVMPYLTQLKGQFTQYQLKNIAQFNSVHSIRIYELLTQYKPVGSREITVDNLKKWLQIEDKYPRYNSLNEWVLTPSINEINTKSNLNVNFETIKRGRKIHALKFIIKSKKAISESGTKRPKFPHKNKYGKFVKLDKQNPKMSSHEFDLYGRDCLKILESFYEKIEDVTTEDLRNYWVFLAVNQSNKSKLGNKQSFIDELKKRGYKLVECELVKLPNLS